MCQKAVQLNCCKTVTFYGTLHNRLSLIYSLFFSYWRLVDGMYNLMYILRITIDHVDCVFPAIN